MMPNANTLWNTQNFLSAWHVVCKGKFPIHKMSSIFPWNFAQEQTKRLQKIKSCANETYLI